MKRLACVLLLLCLASVTTSSAAPASEKLRWRVIARGTDHGERAVAAVALQRIVKLAVRVRYAGRTAFSTAQLHTVTTCSNSTSSLISSRRAKFWLTAPALRVLRLPGPSPINCGVTAIGVAQGGSGTSITVEILAPCYVQRDGRCTVCCIGN